MAGNSEISDDPQGENDVWNRGSGDVGSESSHDHSSSSSPSGSSPSENGTALDTEASGDRQSNDDGEGPSPFLQFQRDMRNQRERLRRQNYYLTIVSGLLIITLIVSIGVNLWVSTTNRIEPFMVAINEKTGEVMRSGTPEVMQGLTEPVVKQQIEEIIRGFRVVFTDPRATRKRYREAWNRVLPNSDAEEFLRSTLSIGTENSISPPALVDEDVQRTVTEVEITRVEGTRTYNVRWIERELISAEQIRERAFSGSMSTTRIKEIDEEALQDNPLGFYVDGISWQQTSTEMIQADMEDGDS